MNMFTHNLLAQLKVKLLWGIVFLAGFLFFSTEDAKASHVVGSDISYECVPGAPPGTFLIRLVLYRDCAGIPMCSGGCGAACFRSVGIQGADPSCNGQSFGNVTVNLVNVRDVNPNPDCPTAKSTCTNMGCVQPGTFTPAVERYEFTGQVNLNSLGIPASCCNIRLTWSECCRNGAITTGASGQNFYMEAIVNRCLSSNPCNGSPQLTNDPYAFACNGQPFTFNNGAIDPEFDSLTYAFTPPLAGANTPTPFNPPFSFDAPMPWTGPKSGVFPAGIACDPITGDIMFTPGGTTQTIGVMAIAVTAWKTVNGVPTILGVTRRDIQMVILQCPPNNPPRIATNPSGPGNQPKMSWDVCAGTQLCFDVIAKDTDFNPPVISDTTKLNWNAALARFGATFVPNYNPATRRILGPREDTYKFCWTPDDSRASTTPYYFTVTAKDSRCPLPGTLTRAISIRVRANPDVTISKTDLKCGKWQVTYVTPTNKPTQNFSFRSYQISREPGDFSFLQGAYTYNNVQTTPVLNFTKGGRYLVQLSMSLPGPIGGSPCTKIFYDTLVVDTPVQPILRDTFLCVGNSVQMTASARYGRPLYNYRWFNNIKDTLVPLNGPIFTNGSLTVAPSQTRNYTVQVRDINGCRVYDSITVDVRRSPIGVLPDSMRLCYGDTFVLNPGNDGGRVKKFLWSTGDTLQTITRGDSNRYVVKLTDTSGCVQTDTMMLLVNSRIIPNAGIDTSICMNDTATLTASGGHLYVWKNLSTSGILSAKSHNRTIRVNPTNTAIPTQYEVTVYQSYPDTTSRTLECSVRDTVMVTVNPLPVLTRPQPVQACKSANLVNAPNFGVNQPGGVGIWSYAPAPGAVINGTLIQFKIDSLKNIPLTDTIRQFDNWLVYKYTAPAVSGGCTRTDSSIVRIYGNPPVKAGPTLVWCENAGVYTINTTNQKYSPSSITNSGVQEEWTGNGIYFTVNGLTKQHFFDPNRPGVQKLPGINIQKYKYTHIYNPGNPSIRIDCVNEDTVQFRVTPIPVINAGNNFSICKSEPTFNISTKSGAFITPFTGASYWTAPVSMPTYPYNTEIRPAMNDSLTFNAGHSSVPNPGNAVIPPATEPGTKRYLLYFEDKSTGCLVRDSIVMTVVRVPDVAISYSSPSVDSPLVCKTKGDVFFNCTVNGMLNSGGVYGGSAAFMKNGLGVSSPNSLFNTLNGAAQSSNTLIYTWTTNAAGISCTSADTSYINLQTPPTIDVADGGAICDYKDTIPVSVLSVGNGYTHTWFTNGGGRFIDSLSLNTSYLPDSMDKVAGTVWVKAFTNAKDKCPVTADSTTLTIHKTPKAVALCDKCEGCVPLDAKYSAGPSGISDPVTYTWTWDDGQSSTGTTMNRVYTDYSGTGVYTGMLRAVSQAGCESTAPFTATAHAIPDADFTSDPEDFTTIAKPFFNFYNKSTVEDNSSMTYLWRLGKDLYDSTKMRTSTEHSPMNVEYEADTGRQTIWLVATTVHGCVDSTYRRIRIDPDITVFIPNAFYPGSNVNCLDGELCNRRFKVAADGHLSIEIFIFNRWGQQVYYSTDANEGWDGKMNNGRNGGQDCQQDVYIYQVNATSYNGKKYKYSGSVTLLR